ncbi:hypothetical protein PoB_004646800 [Plakobranchus ocellatus]|uniref:Uncharacterized protein n=1 Tax=Plakobranchus ocellatus TaxID=259542 RepID=A0AAV4BMC6_9GAST|nr:hypothetical protein PoB_004646800 [Plakobranchus ocellatus]
MSHSGQGSFSLHHRSFHYPPSKMSNIDSILKHMMYIVSPQQWDLRLLDSPPGQGAGSGTRARDRRVPVDLRADSLATEPPTPHTMSNIRSKLRFGTAGQENKGKRKSTKPRSERASEPTSERAGSGSCRDTR